MEFVPLSMENTAHAMIVFPDVLSDANAVFAVEESGDEEYVPWTLVTCVPVTARRFTRSICASAVRVHNKIRIRYLMASPIAGRRTTEP